MGFWQSPSLQSGLGSGYIACGNNNYTRHVRVAESGLAGDSKSLHTWVRIPLRAPFIMKLLNRPERVVEQFDLVGIGGSVQRMSGRATTSNVKIVCPDQTPGDKDEVWDKLKYGTQLDFTIGQKIDRIIFHEEDEEIVLHGVIPVGFERSLIWEGKIIECHVDHYEINPRIG